MDDEPVVGWRFWGGLQVDDAGRPVLVSPWSKLLKALGPDGLWVGPAKVNTKCFVGRCRPAPGPYCACGLFAYRTLQDLSLYVARTTAVALVEGSGPVWWSISDDRGVAWRAERIRLRALIVPSSCPIPLDRLEDTFEVTVHTVGAAVDRDADQLAAARARLDQIETQGADLPPAWKGKMDHWLRLGRALASMAVAPAHLLTGGLPDWAEQTGMPNVWRAPGFELAGRQPGGEQTVPVGVQPGAWPPPPILANPPPPMW